ncbi:MAG: FAD-binding domain-containing protein, partial [Deltaproteobacteria bacterium]|nr:FAD-binding domain-containing protein [Deltaproteobacteria bacterium]
RAGRERLRRFLRGPGGEYDTLRDRPGAAATSRLSVDLHFGTVSVRAAYRAGAAGLSARPAAQAAFLRQLVWREFALHLLHAHPTLLERPFRADWVGFPFRDDEAGYQAWAEGRTGYPIVDAAARQLLAEGYVENRARMVAASFLVKDLLVDFRRGEAHYMANLVDADWASNDLGWQWVTGCGCDAQPWFRVFHPVLQGERFDPEGEYVRRHVPELCRMPSRYVHRPWEAPAAVLREAGVELGRDYPRPIVDHREAAARFLSVARGHLGRDRP